MKRFGAYILFACVAACSVFLIFWFSGSASEKGEAIYSDEYATESLNRCFDNKDAVQACTRGIVKSLLEQRSEADVMELMSGALTTGACHTVGHVVGQEAYLKHGDLEKTIDGCRHLCGAACIHGAAGQAFIEEAGITADTDVQHLSIDNIKRYGQSLCGRVSTCHGVGHILLQGYNDLLVPINVCRDVARGIQQQSCFTGVFMEHADSISTHNLLLGTKKQQTRDPNNLKAPCDSIEKDARHACLRYLPRLQTPHLEEKGMNDAEIGELLVQTCEAFTDIKDRSDCFEGLGFESYRLIEKDVGVAREYCEQFILPTDRAGCMVGMIFWAASYGQITETLAYCAGVRGVYEQDVCYHSIFDILEGNDETLESMRMRCDAHGAKSCLRGLEEYEKDPWKTLYGLKV